MKEICVKKGKTRKLIPAKCDFFQFLDEPPPFWKLSPFPFSTKSSLTPPPFWDFLNIIFTIFTSFLNTTASFPSLDLHSSIISRFLYRPYRQKFLVACPTFPVTLKFQEYRKLTQLSSVSKLQPPRIIGIFTSRSYNVNTPLSQGNAGFNSQSWLVHTQNTEINSKLTSVLFHWDVMGEINNFNCLLEELNFHILWRELSTRHRL